MSTQANLFWWHLKLCIMQLCFTALSLTIKNNSDEDLVISQSLKCGSYVDLIRSPVVGKDDRVVTVESVSINIHTYTH